MSQRKKMLRKLLILILILVSSENLIAEDANDLFDLSIEELMNVEVASTATLTEAKPRLVPAAVTTITAEDIQLSGARSLFELLDIYVPNLQWIRHNWEMGHLGLRGIIGDRDDKYLILVNGRIINDQTRSCAISELDLMYLKDINHIDIVRGPSSGLYGPGAVSMVINIVTDNAETFQGTEITSRFGVIEEFYSTEIKHGQKFEDGGGLFLFGGIGTYSGASKYDAPQFSGLDFPQDASLPWDPNNLGNDIPGEGTGAGDPLVDADLNRDGRTHRNIPPIKGFIELTKGNWDIWARYTQGGQKFSLDDTRIAHFPAGYAEFFGTPQVQNTSGYQQVTTFFGYNKEITDKLEIDLAFSYAMMDFERQIGNELFDAYRSDEYYAKAMLRYNLNNNHKIATGFEVTHDEFGYDSPGWPHEDATTLEFQQSGFDMPRWSTNLYSFVFEDQWKINDEWTSFIGGRIDKNTFTDYMYSPRASLVYTPNEKDTYKLMWARSLRSNNAQVMKIQDMNDNGISDPETLDSIEIRYERVQSKNLDLAASVFVHYNLDVIGWSNADLSSVNIGTQRDWGFELEAAYHTKNTRVAISHGFTKLYDFNLEQGKNTFIAAEPYDDLANWSNNVTKITAQHKLNEKWTIDGSFREYWGFSGMEDYVEQNNTRVDTDWERSYRGNSYLNAGIQYQAKKNLTFNINGYYLLGIFNKDFNKRNYYGTSTGSYRCHAPSVALSMIYKF
ncbi:MAG: TonB-dependent receptor plug domain-containing protein [Sedimentisphaerales bacterium]|nr:TonB-dependent receptor plug domain-containing protein [Sedimentisphaerales bacterium]